MEGIITADDAADSLAALYGGALAAGSDISAFGTAITQLLNVPGRQLTFSSQGILDISINSGFASGAFWDAMNGPQPQVVIAEPVGSNRTIRIVWECVAHIAPCSDSDSITPMQGITEFTYDARFSITPEGMTQRTITGTIEIRHSLVGAPQGGPSPQAPYDNADLYRSYVNVPIVPGFHRRQEYNISRDKRILEFLIVDTEIPSDNPLYGGVVDMDIDHRISSTLEDKGFVTWQNTISGDVTIAPGVARHVAWLAFLAVLDARRRKTPFGLVKMEGGQTEISKHIVTAIEIKEAIFGRTMSFSVSYTLWATIDHTQATTEFQSVMQASGMFEKLDPAEFDWNVWAASLANSVFDRRGYAKMGLKVSDDFIVNHCNSRTLQANADLLHPSHEQPEYLFTNACPPVERSWLEWKGSIRIYSTPNIIGHRRIRQTPLSAVQEQSTVPNRAYEGFRLPSNQGTDDNFIVAQIRGRPRYIIAVRAYSRRMGYPIPQPEVKRFGSLDVVPIDPKDYRLNGSNFYSNEQTSGGPCPVYEMWFEQYYLLPGKPSDQDLKDYEGSAKSEVFQVIG